MKYRSRGGAAGVTLLELLLVMTILAVVVGGGLGMFAALDLGKRQAAGIVKNVLRSAQNSAIARQAPARVRIDAKNGTLLAEAMLVVGTWHFENRSVDGAFGLDGAVSPNVEFVRDGYLGDALSFGGSPNAYAEIGVEHDPAFDFLNGFTLECAVRRDSTGGGRLIRVGSTCRIDINPAGRVRGSFTAELDEDGRKKAGGRVFVESPPGMIIAERWTLLRFEYDRKALKLFVDGVQVARTNETAPVWKIDGPLVLSDRSLPFHGAIDSLVVSAVAGDELVELPETVTFGKDTPDEVVFDAGGGLDRYFHEDPVVITLDFDDGSSQSVGVGIYGTVE